MPPEFLIPEFQAPLRPIALLLKLVNMFWGLGVALLLPAFFSASDWLHLRFSRAAGPGSNDHASA